MAPDRAAPAAAPRRKPPARLVGVEAALAGDPILGFHRIEQGGEPGLGLRQIDGAHQGQTGMRSRQASPPRTARLLRALVQAGQPAPVVHREGEQAGVGDLAWIDQAGGIHMGQGQQAGASGQKTWP